MEKENWIKWLQARIPVLKESHNEIWLGIALDGYLDSKQNQALSMSGVSDSFCDLYKKQCNGNLCSVSSNPEKCDHLKQNDS